MPLEADAVFRLVVVGIGIPELAVVPFVIGLLAPGARHFIGRTRKAIAQ
jgi:hypothetical protein